MLAGGLAGIVAWTIATPMDVIKARLQVDGALETRRYKGFFHCITETVRQEGVGVFFKSLSINCVRAVPVSIVVFVTYEVFTGLLRAGPGRVDPPRLGVWKGLTVSSLNASYPAMVCSSVFHHSVCFYIYIMIRDACFHCHHELCVTGHTSIIFRFPNILRSLFVMVLCGTIPLDGVLWEFITYFSFYCCTILIVLNKGMGQL